MCNFKTGQRVVSLTSDWILKKTTSKNPNSPNKDEIVTVKYISGGFIALEEYLKNEYGIQWFEAKWFRPIVSDTIVSELVSKIVEEKPEIQLIPEEV